MKRKKNPITDQSLERWIVTGLIVSTEYAKRIREVLQRNLIGSSTARILINWCLEYYEKYDKAPGRHIQDVFNEKKKSLKEDDANDIAEILAGLSDDYEQEEHFNPDYLYDQTVDHFRRKQARDLITQSTIALDNGDVDEAEELLRDYKPLEIVSYSKINEFILNLDQMMKLDIEKPRLLMSPWLREGQVTFIYGQYGTGKSLLAINIAELLALNIEDAPNWDIGEWQVKNPTGCLYLDGEMG